jgi:hypothetical protein
LDYIFDCCHSRRALVGRITACTARRPSL